MAFLFTTCIALWVTYDPDSKLTNLRTPVGLDKFWLIIGAVLIYYAFAHLAGRDELWQVTFGMGLFAGILGVYFLLTNDFSNQGAKFQWLWEVGVKIQKVLPNLSLHALHPNVMGGLIAMFLPSGLLSLAWAYRIKQPFWKIISLIVLAFSLLLGGLALLLSMSRGAWIALAAGLSGWAGYVLIDSVTIRLKWDRKLVDRFLATGLVAGGVLVIILVWTYASQILRLFPPLGDTANIGQSDFGRYELMKASSQLIRDYPLTGIGLGTFPMVFSTYAILIQVPYIVHAHNLFLNLTISQGLPGLAAWLAVLAGALILAWQLKRKSELPVAASIVMLVVLLVHGLVDDPLYGSRAVLFWWIPAGLLAAQAQVATGEARHVLTRLEFGLAVGVGGMLLLLLVGLVILPPWRAQAIANLGAVYQTQIELGNYQPDQWDTKSIDQVRRQVDLSLATKAFDQALAIDPHQRTALQRLAEIDLSRQAYDQALAKLQKIPASRASDAVSRLLLGDALVATGDPKGAAVIVEGLPFSQGRLLEQSWYRYYKDGDTKRENWASQAASLLK